MGEASTVPAYELYELTDLSPFSAQCWISHAISTRDSESM